MDAPTVKKSMPTCMPAQMGHGEDKRHDWVVDIPVNLKLEDVMEPGYWSIVADQFDPLDHIEIRSEDGSWIAYLIVSRCERTYARVVLDRVVKLEVSNEAPPNSILHKVEWKGGVNKYSVIRLADSKMVQSGFRTQDQAYAWMKEHEQSAK